MVGRIIDSIRKDSTRFVGPVCGLIAFGIVFAWIYVLAEQSRYAKAPAPSGDKIPCFVHPNIPNTKICGLTAYHFQNGGWAYMGKLTPVRPLPDGRSE